VRGPSIDDAAFFPDIAALVRATEDAGMPLSNERYVDVDGIRTRYFEKGKGEPIVLLHGS